MYRNNSSIQFLKGSIVWIKISINKKQKEKKKEGREEILLRRRLKGVIFSVV